jgi:hypothetical protein
MPMKLYRPFAFSCAVIFAMVGVLFLFWSDGVVVFFNMLSSRIGITIAPVPSVHFYLILAVAYMYLVTVIAWLMFRNPGSALLPLLLANAKLASSLLSFGLYIFHNPFLIYITNGIVDGGLGLVCLYFYSVIRKQPS